MHEVIESSPDGLSEREEDYAQKQKEGWGGGGVT
jgi:hypothetical protein